MELKSYIKLLTHNFLFILICVVVASGIAAYTASSSQGGYVLEHTYYLQEQQPEQLTTLETNQAQANEKYYKQELARNFTDTAVAILNRPDFSSQFAQGKSKISAEKIAPQVVNLTVNSPDASETQFLLERTVIGFNQNVKIIAPGNNIELKAVGPLPAPKIASLDTKVIIAAGAILGFALAVCTVALKTYLRL